MVAIEMGLRGEDTQKGLTVEDFFFYFEEQERERERNINIQMQIQKEKDLE